MIDARATDDLFKRFVWYSVLGHLFVILVFNLPSCFYKTENIEIQTAMRVDVVDLPDKFLPKKIAPKTSPKVRMQELPKEDVEQELKKLEKKQNSAFEKINAMEALEKIARENKEEMEQKNSEKNETSNDSNLNSLTEKLHDDIDSQVDKIRGQTISDGSQFAGLNKISVQKYLSQISTRVQENFVAPAFLNTDGLKAYVVVQLDENGFVVQRSLDKSSGNNIFDQSVLTAVDRSSPFPAPPERLKNTIKHNKIILRFPGQ